ncbi:acetyltransferase [Tunicatimonas pelagia]|uniref:acetyltransferase n=1 Tax=Tunicatimonas pelagia TaxID=931531 RepID=UPI002666C060|nr:acetyltransferase [Tunicatimonas pelagia]WKN42826.1 acetyltransferase [Tunicatimonas pelagia]
MRELILIGGGGHARSVIDVVESAGDFRIMGIADRKEKIGEKVLNYVIIAADSQLASLVNNDRNFLLTVGQVETAETRVRLDRELKQVGGKLARVVSPLARISDYATIAEGAVVMHFALVNAGAQVGRNVIINTRAVVEHDAVVGDFCHISTGAILNGGVKVGNQVLVGSQATVRQGIEIANNVTIGAQSYVNQDILEAGVYVGVPARRIR